MNGQVCFGDAVPLSATVGNTSAAIICTIGDPSLRNDAKYLRVSNLSANYVYLSVNAPAEKNKGLVLAPKGTDGWYVEFNNTNMFYGTLNAVSDGSGTLAILIGG